MNEIKWSWDDWNYFEKDQNFLRQIKSSHRSSRELYRYRRRELEIAVGDMVFIKVAPWKWVIRFQKRDKLNHRYISPFKIFERIGSVAYRLELSRDLERNYDIFHVSLLRKYISNPSHVLKAPPIELEEDLIFEIQPVGIVDQRMKELRNKVILMVNVLWKSDTVEEMTWETKAFMRSHYPYLFTN